MAYRKELRAWLLDLLDFIQERLNDALADEGSQRAALK
jgi:hypothetical protein